MRRKELVIKPFQQTTVSNKRKQEKYKYLDLPESWKSWGKWRSWWWCQLLLVPLEWSLRYWQGIDQRKNQNHPDNRILKKCPGDYLSFSLWFQVKLVWNPTRSKRKMKCVCVYKVKGKRQPFLKYTNTERHTWRNYKELSMFFQISIQL